MEGICLGKGIVIGINLIFGLFSNKTRGSCVYNMTAEKKKVCADSLYVTSLIN